MDDKKLDLILNKIEEMKSEFQTDMKQMKDEIHKDMKQMKVGIQTDMKQMKDEIHKDMKLMKAQLDENTEMIKAILHRQDETDAKLEGLSLDFAKLHEEVVSIKADVSQLIEDQKSIHGLLGEHEISIRSLRRIIV